MCYAFEMWNLFIHSREIVVFYRQMRYLLNEFYFKIRKFHVTKSIGWFWMCGFNHIHARWNTFSGPDKLNCRSRNFSMMIHSASHAYSERERKTQTQTHTSFHTRSNIALWTISYGFKRNKCKIQNIQQRMILYKRMATTRTNDAQ